MKKSWLLLIVFLGVPNTSRRERAVVEANLNQVHVGVNKNRLVAITGQGYRVIWDCEGHPVLTYQTCNPVIYKFLFVENQLRAYKRKPWRKRIQIHSKIKKNRIGK